MCQRRYARMKIKTCAEKKRSRVGYGSLERHSIQVIPKCTGIASVSSFAHSYFLPFFKGFVWTIQKANLNEYVVWTDLALALRVTKTLEVVPSRKRSVSEGQGQELGSNVRHLTQLLVM